MLLKVKGNVLIVHVVSTKAVPVKEHVPDAHLVLSLVNKDQRVLMNVSQFVVSVPTHPPDSFHVLNVQEIVTPAHHHKMASRNANLAHLLHSPTNHPLLDQNTAVRSANLELTLQPDWPHAHLAPLVSTNHVKVKHAAWNVLLKLPL